MQFVSISRRRTDEFPPEAFTAELVGGEAKRVKALYASGILRHVWKRGDAGGAVILWEAASVAEVHLALESLPLFQAGLLAVETVVPLEPYAGFAS